MTNQERVARSAIGPCQYTSIDLSELTQLLDARRPQLIDVLGAGDFRWAHLPGARNVPLSHIKGVAPDAIDQARPVVVYCNDFL